ncbi:unnamed protein product [Nyctereutes procyonoides]|uniref:(raccoon dog) hypothetical protein n=1 Tax=Nyctereutes procyonoides TaxID=34880 RepID=A0A811ZDC6_NYCPR|nr:unnamed protein product [Nyctereutes procyonoides]
MWCTSRPMTASMETRGPPSWHRVSSSPLSSSRGFCWWTTHVAVICPFPSHQRPQLACLPIAYPPHCSLVCFSESLPARGCKGKEFTRQGLKPWDGTEQMLGSHGFSPSTRRTAGCPPGAEGRPAVPPQVEPGLARSMWVKRRNLVDGPQSRLVPAAPAAREGGRRDGKGGLQDLTRKARDQGPSCCGLGAQVRETHPREVLPSIRGPSNVAFTGKPPLLNTFSFLEYSTAVALLII